MESGNLEVRERNGTLLQFMSGGRWTKLARDLSCEVAHATKVYRGRRGKLRSFLTTGLDGDEGFHVPAALFRQK